jgi:hypothetical protein
MSHIKSSQWLTAFGEWVVMTLSLIFVGLALVALGCGVWIFFLVISAGYEARFLPVTSSFTTPKAGLSRNNPPDPTSGLPNVGNLSSDP